MNTKKIKSNIIISIKKFLNFDDNVSLINLIDKFVVNNNIHFIENKKNSEIDQEYDSNSDFKLDFKLELESKPLYDCKTEISNQIKINEDTYNKLYYQIKIARVYDNNNDYESEINFLVGYEHLDPIEIIQNEFAYVQEYIKKNYPIYGTEWYIDLKIKNK